MIYNNIIDILLIYYYQIEENINKFHYIIIIY